MKGMVLNDAIIKNLLSTCVHVVTGGDQFLDKLESIGL